jgi:hypothetical protein
VLISQPLGIDGVIVLRAAMAPPANQIWIQNRTGERESVIVNNELYEIAPAAVQEFSVELEGPVIVQLRSCIGTAERTVCEWIPQGVEAGFYYGLVHMLTPGPEHPADQRDAAGNSCQQRRDNPAAAPGYLSAAGAHLECAQRPWSGVSDHRQESAASTTSQGRLWWWRLTGAKAGCR